MNEDEMDKPISLDEYIEHAKKELDEFKAMWENGMTFEPENYPAKISLDQWGDQELASRFGILP